MGPKAANVFMRTPLANITFTMRSRCVAAIGTAAGIKVTGRGDPVLGLEEWVSTTTTTATTTSSSYQMRNILQSVGRSGAAALRFPTVVFALFGAVWLYLS